MTYKENSSIYSLTFETEKTKEQNVAGGKYINGKINLNLL